MAWWYAAISAGFVLLAIVYTVLHDKPWMIAVRVVIAAGFAFLAALEFRSKRRGR
jgi:hypothetical protein